MGRPNKIAEIEKRANLFLLMARDPENGVTVKQLDSWMIGQRELHQPRNPPHLAKCRNPACEDIFIYSQYVSTKLTCPICLRTASLEDWDKLGPLSMTEDGIYKVIRGSDFIERVGSNSYRLKTDSDSFAKMTREFIKAEKHFEFICTNYFIYCMEKHFMTLIYNNNITGGKSYGEGFEKFERRYEKDPGIKLIMIVCTISPTALSFLTDKNFYQTLRDSAPSHILNLPKYSSEEINKYVRNNFGLDIENVNIYPQILSLFISCIATDILKYKQSRLALEIIRENKKRIVEALEGDFKEAFKLLTYIKENGQQTIFRNVSEEMLMIREIREKVKQEGGNEEG